MLLLKEDGVLGLHRLSEGTLFKVGILVKFWGMMLELWARGRRVLRQYHQEVMIRMAYLRFRE